MNSSALATDMNRQASYLIELMQLHDADAAKQMAWDFFHPVISFVMVWLLYSIIKMPSLLQMKYIFQVVDKTIHGTHKKV